MFDDAAEMRTGDEFHRAVSFVHIVEGEPDSHGIVGLHWPVIRILVPADGGHRARLFDKEVTRPVVEIGTENAFDEIENLGMLTDIVEIGAGLVPLADVLGSFTFLEESEEGRQLGVDLVHFFLGEDGRETEEVTVFVIRGFLFFAELVSGHESEESHKLLK